MAQLATLMADAEAAGAPAIDRGHLKQMTFGDRSLERELLELFDRQAVILIARMRESDADAVATLAHTLKGSARGIGAAAVARAAEAAERAADKAECLAAIDRLAAAIADTRALIADMLRAQ